MRKIDLDTSRKCLYCGEHSIGWYKMRNGGVLCDDCGDMIISLDSIQLDHSTGSDSPQQCKKSLSSEDPSTTCGSDEQSNQQGRLGSLFSLVQFRMRSVRSQAGALGQWYLLRFCKIWRLLRALGALVVSLFFPSVNVEDRRDVSR